MKKYNRCCDNCKYAHKTSYEYGDSECLIFGEEPPIELANNKCENGCCLHHKELAKLEEILKLKPNGERCLKYSDYIEILEEKYGGQNNER